MSVIVLISTNISEFKRGYDQELAKAHMNNYGKIFYNSQYHEPLEIEDVEYYIESGYIKL